MKVYEEGDQGVHYETFATEEDGHGRHEKRLYEIITDPQGLRHQDAWPQLHVIGKCNTERTVKGKTTCEVRYFSAAITVR